MLQWQGLKIGECCHHCEMIRSWQVNMSICLKKKKVAQAFEFAFSSELLVYVLDLQGNVDAFLA